MAYELMINGVIYVRGLTEGEEGHRWSNQEGYLCQRGRQRYVSYFETKVRRFL